MHNDIILYLYPYVLIYILVSIRQGVVMVIPKIYPHSYLQSRFFIDISIRDPLGFLPAKLWRRRQIPRTGLSRYWAKTFPEAFHKSQIWAFRKTFYPIPWLTVLMHHHPLLHVKRLRGTRLYRCIKKTLSGLKGMRNLEKARQKSDFPIYLTE